MKSTGKLYMSWFLSRFVRSSLMLFFICIRLTVFCQLNVQEKQRLIRPLVARLKENPNDAAACSELIRVASTPATLDLNNSNDVATNQETIRLLQSVGEPCWSNGTSQQAPSTSSPSINNIGNNIHQESIMQIVSGAQNGYQKYADEISDLQIRIGPAEQQKAQAASALQHTIDNSLDNLLIDLISEEKEPERNQEEKTQEQLEEEAIANFQLPPHGGYFEILFEDTLLRVEANLRLIKSKKCYSHDNLRGVGPYGNYRYELELRIIRKKKVSLITSHEFKCATDFQQDVFDPFKCLRDEQGYWDRFWVVDQNISWPAENNDFTVISGQFWTTVPNPPVKWAIKYD